MSNFLPIGERLKEERERLVLSQTDFAALGGAGRKTQFNYETGERVPDAAYLAAIAAAGADVLYILTGQRGAPIAPALKPDEAALLDNYRHCSTEMQQAAKTQLAAMAKPKGKMKKVG